MEYLIGNKKDFWNFVDKIEKRDRVGIITHTDLDGIASAIVLNEILRNKKVKLKEINFIDYGVGMFEDSKKRFLKKKINKIFILDVNFDADYEGFKDLKKNFDVLLIDHHPSEIKEEGMIKTNSYDCVTFVLYEFAKDKLNLSRFDGLVCATMVAEFSYKDESNFKFLKKHYPEITKENMINSIPAELSKEISSSLIYFKEKKKKVYNLVLRNKLNSLKKYRKIVDKEIQSLVKTFGEDAEFFPDKDLYFYQGRSKFNVTSIVTTILSIDKPDKTFVLVSDVEDKPDYYKASSRNQSGKRDMNQLMRKAVEGLENATAGGHVPAAAARFMKKDLQKFKENLLS